MSQKEKIKNFIYSLTDENYAAAYRHLSDALYDKTKKRCSLAYEKVKKFHEKNKY